MGKRPRALAATAVGLLVAVLSTTGRGAAQEPPVVATRTTDAPFYVEARGGPPRLVGEGRVVPLGLPDRVRLEELFDLGGGWLLTTTTRGEDGRERPLLVRASSSGEAEHLPRLPFPGRVAHSTVPFVDDGRLVGAAWLGGSSEAEMGLYAAVWNGSEWQGAWRVAAPGPGSQLTPDGAVLADGSWLLVWSRFDGNDNEIFWSVRRGDSWSGPLRIAGDDEYPDITPALAVTGEGALLAWSGYDGETYRIEIARFQGDAWSPVETLPDRGAAHPSWHPGPLGLHLLYREGRDGSWVVRQVGAKGSSIERVRRTAPPAPRPVLRSETGSLRLVRPGGLAYLSGG